MPITAFYCYTHLCTKVEVNSMIKRPSCHDEQGFVLVAAMLCLVVLTLIGIAAMNTSYFEKLIAQNINQAEKTFYGADGGTEAGIEMIEQNLGCPEGFTGIGLSDTDPNAFYNLGGLQITDSKFAYDEDSASLPLDRVALGLGPTDPIPASAFPSDAARSIRIPDDMAAPSDASPHTNLAIFGVNDLAAGSNPNQAAGYSDQGKGPGGKIINFEVFSQRVDILNSSSIIRLGWRHLIGLEGGCGKY